MLSCFSRVQPLCATLWTTAHQAPVRGFSGEWVAMPSTRGFANPEMEPTSLTSPALADGFFTTSVTWEGKPYEVFMSGILHLLFLDCD